MKIDSNDFSAIIKFTAAYRMMEAATVNTGKRIIKQVVPAHQVKHLCNSWAGRQNDFGSFFLNLSHQNQGRFILHFGIPLDGFDAFDSEIANDPAAYVYAKPPFLVDLIHHIILFFNNHAIEDSSFSEFVLPGSPADRFGNSANWGEYLLSLSVQDQLRVLEHIVKEIRDDMEQVTNNREFMATSIRASYGKPLQS